MATAGLARGLHVEPGELDSPDKRAGYTVCVVGLNRLGLSSACLWAKASFRVLGADVNAAVISAVRAGRLPFDEPGLHKLLVNALKANRLKLSSDVRRAVSQADFVVITALVPLGGRGKPDYGPLIRACREVGFGLKCGTLVLVQGLVAPGTTEGLLKNELEETSGLKAGRDFGLAFSPVVPANGRFLEALANSPRILGAVDSQSLRAAKAFLQAVGKAGVVEASGIKVAEAAGLFKAVRLEVLWALANELALFSEKAGVDLAEAIGLANLDDLPGPGPSCGLDASYILLDKAEELGVRLRLVGEMSRVSEDVVKHALKLVREALRECGKSLRRAKVVVLGASRGANLKDPEAPVVSSIIRALRERCRQLFVYDPYFTRAELEALDYPAAPSLAEALEGADCLLITAGHAKFRELDLRALRGLMADKAAVVDLSAVVEPGRVKELGLAYRGLGRACRP